jgi:hypothetical protein
MFRSWPVSMVLFLWLTIGFAVVHAVVTAWGVAVLQQAWPDSLQYEVLVLTEEGEAVIQGYTKGVGREFRKLDGTRIPDTLGLPRRFASGIDLMELDGRPPLTWDYRIVSYHDFQKPATFWYLISIPDRQNSAYFVGYDKMTHQLVGYLGIHGFSVQPPGIDESFEITPSGHTAFSGSVAAAQYAYAYSFAHEPDAENLEAQYSHLANVAPDAVWILSRGTVYEILLGQRAVRPLLKNQPELHNIAKEHVLKDGKSTLRLLSRTDTGISIIDPETGSLESIPLDAPRQPNGYESYYELKGGKRAFIHQFASSRRGRNQQHYKVSWLGADGQVEQQEELTLDRGTSFPGPYAGIALAVCVPAPIGALGTLLIAPADESGRVWKAHSYSARFAELASDLMAWIVGSLLVGLVSGWACLCRERDVFGRTGWAWPLLVGICGWFGWIAYICLRPLPARLPSGQWMPSQPEPNRPLGTEIYA